MAGRWGRLVHWSPGRYGSRRYGSRLPLAVGWWVATVQTWYGKMNNVFLRWSEMSALMSGCWKEEARRFDHKESQVVKELQRSDSAPWLLSSQEVIRDLSEGLQKDQRQAAAEDFESQVNLEKLLMERKLRLLKTHGEILGQQISEQDFLLLEEKWQKYFEAMEDEAKKSKRVERWQKYFEAEDPSSRLVSSEKIKSGSSWNMQDLSRYLKAFASLNWSGEATSALKIGSLETHLQSSIDHPCTELHNCLKDDDWKQSYLQRLLLVLQVLRCPLSTFELNSSTIPETVASVDISEWKLFFEAATSEERAEVLLQMLEARAPKVGPVHLSCSGLGKLQRQRIHIAANLLTKQGRRVQSQTNREADRVNIWMETAQPVRSKSKRNRFLEPKEEVFSRIAGLADLQAPEASTRAVIDAVIFPLCASLQLGVTMEENCKFGMFPSSVCDYVLRSDDAKVLAVIEAKRCTPNWAWTLSQGIAQCVWQLAILKESQKAVQPVGLVSDGRRWVCVRLDEHLAISSSLDISREDHFWILLNFLLQHLENFAQFK